MIITITEPNPLEGCKDIDIKERDLMVDAAKSSGMSILQIIENFLKKRIESGDKIEDLTQRQEPDGTLHIFHKLQLISTFRFSNKIIEGDNKSYQYKTNITRQDY